MDTKLYPPQIAGALPAFCKTYDILQDLSTGAKITIPFTMNAGVGEAEVKGFALRIKTASSNIYMCPILYSTNWDKEKSTVTFELGAEYVNRFNEGQFYKVQLAYYNYKTTYVTNLETGEIEETVIDVTSSDNFIIGYYSTVGIIKCIAKPKIFIDGYNNDSVNLFTGTFLGVFDQTESSDKTERVYSFRFDFYDINDNIVQSSGDIIHNINNDTELDYSTDRYSCNDFIQPTEVYKLVYTVTTMNGYVASSPRYKITANTRLAPGRFMEVIATPITIDGCIDVSCKGELGLNPEGKMEEALYYGEFSLSRASEEDGFVEWEFLQEFRLVNQKPSSFHFYDFTVKQGTKYIYSIQQFNMSKLYSTRILSEPASVDFEDMFLFDGERSLKIRFNPKVSSFKTTHLEKKVETIGSKYPFVFRNGAVGYKEFPVEGLISYHMDDNQNFFKREELYNFYRMNEETRKKAMDKKYIEYHRKTDLTEDNVLLERQFKTMVLDWLNNGEPKLFKSAPEGNFIVRLINISLTPEDTLGRMLHTFKSTAIEIADCTLANLKKYGFSVGGAISSFVPLWRTYSFTELSLSKDGRGKELVFEQEVTSFKIENVLPGTKVYIYYLGSDIPEEVMIGATGAYYFTGSDRQAVKLLFVFDDLNVQGHIECEYIGRRYSNFDAVTGISLRTIISNQVVGTSSALESMLNSDVNIPNFKLATKALADTNYRTYLNNYLSMEQIESVLNEDKLTTGEEKTDETTLKRWQNLLEDLDLLDEQTNKIKQDTSFDPCDTMQYIKTDFYNFERSKLSVVNLEQARVRQRELIPVYVVPYEMVTPEAWKKLPSSVGKDSLYLSKPVWQVIDGVTYYHDHYTREDYENPQFPTDKLLFSTTPFGRPYPIDELITYLTLQVQTYEQMIDKHFIYIIYKYNTETREWEVIKNKSDVLHFSGSYYDPYRKELIEDYKTTFYINDKYRYDPITKEDVSRLDKRFFFSLASGKLLKNNEVYVKEDQGYILASEKFTYSDEYELWVSDKEPNEFYIKSENNIDIKYAKEMSFEQLGVVDSFGISNGIIVEQTFQLQMMDYYTEVNDAKTKAAKERYQKQYNFLMNVFKMLDNIEQADIKQNKYETLYSLYDLILKGCNVENNPLSTYDFLILYILLEKKEIDADTLEKYFLPKLNKDVSIDSYEVTKNLESIIEDYRGKEGISIEELINRLFTTENSIYATAYNKKKNIYITIYNEINKYGNLELIDGEEDDLLFLVSNDKITGLESKYLSLQRLYDTIKAQIDEKEEQANSLATDFQKAQNAVLDSYEQYNNEIGKIAVVEWIKELRKLNSELDLLDFLTIVETEYATIAEGINLESQYEQEEIKKWQAVYKNNYENIKGILAENIVLQKILTDNEDDPTLDDYIQMQIDGNLKHTIILASQMEAIEKTKYKDVTWIIDPETVEEEYPNRQLTSPSSLSYLYNSIATRINSLNNNITTALLELNLKEDELISIDDTKLIKTIQEFVLEVDNYELFMTFCNFTNTKVFNIAQNDEWIEARENYIKKLPLTERGKLERNILKINLTADDIQSDLIKGDEVVENKEPWYLFSMDTNLPEYRNRVLYLLEAIRAIIKTYDTVKESLDQIIEVTNGVSEYQLKSYPSKIEGPIDELNTKIKVMNEYIVTYVDLLKTNKNITANNNAKWNELLNDFNIIYPFDAYSAEEPPQYQQKIAFAKDINSSVFNLTYFEEDVVTKKIVDNANEYYLKDVVILPANREINENTFTTTYRYFSSFYAKLIGEFFDNTGTGMLWWYLEEVLKKEIEYERQVLAEMQLLLDIYFKKISNYSDKRDKYQTLYKDAQLIYLQYSQEYPDVFNYYASGSEDQYVLIERAIQDTKKFWNLFVLELDLGYKREIERGMYG